MARRFWVIAAIVAVAALVVGVSLGVAGGGGSHSGSSDGMSMDMSSGSSTATSSPSGSAMPEMSGSHMSAMSERAFLREMVPHHESAIEMARLAQDKASHPQVRRLAGAIIAAQESEVAQMKRWYRAWYGEDLPEAEHSAMMDMGELETAAGAEFDRVFLRMMIAHHAAAIVMADSVKMGKPRPQVRALAARITAAQAKEIGQMQRWREAWFPPLG